MGLGAKSGVAGSEEEGGDEPEEEDVAEVVF
jgi:hypothetical protein